MRVFKLFKKKPINSNLVLKKDNDLILKKRFLKKIPLNSSISEINYFVSCKKPENEILSLSNLLDIKTDLYKSLKILKTSKYHNLSSNLNLDLNNFCFKLQSSKLFSSNIEIQKKKKRKKIIRLLRNIWWKKILHSSKSFEKISYLSILKKTYAKKKKKEFLLNKKKGVKRKKFLKRQIKKGFKFSSNSFKYVSKTKWTFFMKFLKTRRFSQKMVGLRFFLFLPKKSLSALKKTKKKFKFSPSLLNTKLRRVSFFLNIYPLAHLKYVKNKYSSFVLLKSLLWRRKKRRRKLKAKLFRIRFIRRAFRYRRRLLYKFYIPKHIEVNLKTLSFTSHSSPDIPTLSSKIPFWLNIRRLLTFMAF